MIVGVRYANKWCLECFDFAATTTKKVLSKLYKLISRGHSTTNWKIDQIIWKSLTITISGHTNTISISNLQVIQYCVNRRVNKAKNPQNGINMGEAKKAEDYE